jgi:dipeptidyl aminopeptidase/acylaminoacyl peptidase
MRRVLHSVLPASVLFVLVGSAAAQSVPFTAEDILKVATVNVLDLSEDGRWVAASVRRPFDNETTDHRRFGDPTYLPPSRVRLQIIDTESGAAETPFADLVNVRDAAWSRDSANLAVLIARDATETDALPSAELFVWRATTRTLTQVHLEGGHRVALNTTIAWTPDGKAIFLALRDPALDREARASFKAITEGPIIVHRSSEPFLEWDALRRNDRNRAIALVEPATGAVKILVPQGRFTSFQAARDGSFLTLMQAVTARTDYDTIGGTENELKHVDVRTGETRVLVPAKDLKGAQLRWSDNGRICAYAKQGEVFVRRIDGTEARSLTPKPKKKEDEKDTPPPSDSDPAREKEESFSPVSFSRDGTRLLVTSRKGWYVLAVDGSARDLIVPFNDDEERNPRISAIDWSLDGRAIYATWSERDRWERGIVRIDVASKTVTPLAKDARLYGNVRLSRDGTRFVYTISENDRPADLYAADASFAQAVRLSDVNAWLAARSLPKSELVGYRDADGRQLYGVLRYPIGYEKGRTYPVVFEIYETFFDNSFNGRAAFLTNHGYAVFHPSVNLVVGRPGDAWVKGVTSAANKLIELGIADPERLGVQGTSYGGYATALLITQTDRFKSAVNISGKVNMVSFYTDSPRLGVRNTHAPEKSQDRIGGTLWEFPERYLEHSAVLRADRVKTPLLNITGDQDPNVPASQSREMYYALRRLGKEVEWVRYVNGGHRPPNSNAEAVDFEQRILAWHDKYLKKDSKKTTPTPPQR